MKKLNKVKNMEKINLKKIENVTNIIVCVTIVIYVLVLAIKQTVIPRVTVLFGTKNLETVKNICLYVFWIKILIDVLSGDKIHLPVILIYIITVIIYRATNNNTLLMLISLIIAARKCDIRKIIKIVFIVYCIGFFFITCLSLMGVIPNWTFPERDGTIKNSLGFIYSAVFMGYFLTIILMYCVVRNSKATYIELIILQIINWWLYIITDAMTSFILVTIVLVSMSVYKVVLARGMKEKIKKILNKNVFKAICISVPVVLLILTLLLTYLYGVDNKIGIYLNKVLNTRLELNYSAINRYKINLFGTKIRWNGWGGYGYVDLTPRDKYDYNFVDTSYLRIIFDYGIVMSAIIIGIYTLLIKKILEQKDYWLLLVIMIILIRGFVEHFMVSIEQNIFLISFIYLIRNDKINLINKKKEIF